MRFVLSSGWLRRSDGTVKPDAFMPRPAPHLDLSMFRHMRLTEQEKWDIGRPIAEARSARLHGRADVRADEFTRRGLGLAPAPPKYHVNATGWPADKPSQKMLAIEIAARAHFVVTP